jgi:hypothetical protein
MPKTSSNEGAFLVSETPHIGKAQGRGTGGGGGVLADPTVVLTSGRRFLLREQMSIVGPPVLTLTRPSCFATLYSRLCH